jgi:hypothetical protein
MGKSRKKHNITKIKNKGMRSVAHKRLRKRVNDRIKSGKYEDFPDMRELTNDYDIIDFVSINEDEKYRRK